MKKMAEIFDTTVDKIDSWDGTFIFNNYGQTTNGQIKEQYFFSDKSQYDTQDLMDKLIAENELLKNENTYLKSVIDKILEKSST